MSNHKSHAARYGYYFSASLGYKNTAVKKLTTTSQMIQFLAFMTQVLTGAGPVSPCIENTQLQDIQLLHLQLLRVGDVMWCKSRLDLTI